MTGKYDFIYEKLVTAEDDLVGLIAYGIYKKHKIEFITKIKGELQRDPTEEETVQAISSDSISAK